MAVVIVHYHLNAGGVTRVIEETSRCLREGGVAHVILTGCASTGSDLPFRVIEGLNYLRETGGHSAQRLLDEMRSVTVQALGPGPHVWHFHNHSLGVNLMMPEIVALLATEGERLILQLHDLAEDGRPGNYPLLAASETPYPDAPQIRYAFVNSRDRGRFIAAGVPEERSVLLPNPIRIPAASPESSSSPARVLYPVRGIRRKNLGEVFLLAALSPEGTRYATTLAPTQLRWLPYFEEWRMFSESSGLPVDLAVVGRLPAEDGDSSFESWQAQATHFLSTSVAEGFGLAFLEAAAIGKPLLGRDLPTVTPDLKNQGIKPGRLYQRLLVPCAWIDCGLLNQRLTDALQARFEAYGGDFDHDRVEEMREAMHVDGHFDFGNLPEELQRMAIHRLLNGAPSDEVLVEVDGRRVPASAWLEQTLEWRTPSVTASQLDHYSPTAHLARLTSLHNELLATEPQAPAFLEKRRVLEQYLGAENFHFLLT